MAYYTADATSPAKRGVAVTPSDATELECTRALWVGGAGDVVVVFAELRGNSTPVTLAGVAAGTLLPVQVVKVMAATSATAVVALY